MQTFPHGALPPPPLFPPRVGPRRASRPAGEGGRRPDSPCPGSPPCPSGLCAPAVPSRWLRVGRALRAVPGLRAAGGPQPRYARRVPRSGQRSAPGASSSTAGPGSGRAHPMGRAFFFFGVINPPLPPARATPAALPPRPFLQPATSWGRAGRPPNSPVPRCPGSGSVLRGPGAPAAESESPVLAGLRRAGGSRAEGVKPGASPYLQKVKNVWSLHLLKGRCWLQGVLAPAARKAGQGREFPSTSTKTLQKKAERPTL